MKTEDYSEQYDAMVQNIDMVTYYTIKYHKDVIEGSVCVAAEDGQAVAVGLLKAGSTFLKIDELDLPYYYIHAEFLADTGADTEMQVEASEMILEELKDRFDAIQKKHPTKRLILRLWCNSEKTAYQEFLMAHGFRPMRVTPIMERELTDEDMQFNSELIKVGSEKFLIREMDPEDEDFAREYLITNGEAFEVADSINELRFVMGGEDSHVFAVMKGERVIAALTTWVVSEGRAATENIFCATEYRNRGITTALIEYALGFLREEGFETASLTVFGDNQPAVQLYLKLGYEIAGNMLELHYEKNYKNVGF